MTFEEQLISDMKSALKSGDKDRANSLRFLIAQIHNREIEKRSVGASGAALSDEDVIEVLKKESKRRRESMDMFKSGGRIDLVGREERELVLIKEYLPREATSEEVERLVQGIVDAGNIDFGSVMREAMKELKSRADGHLVSEIVKKKIGEGRK